MKVGFLLFYLRINYIVRVSRTKLNYSPTALLLGIRINLLLQVLDK